MDEHEFLKYEPTPGEKHLGIATVRLYKKIILRFKIVQNKEGTGFFPVPASYKMGGEGPDAKYVPSFMLDSNYEKEELEGLIKTGVAASMSRKPAPIPASYMATPLVHHNSQPQEDLPF